MRKILCAIDVRRILKNFRIISVFLSTFLIELTAKFHWTCVMAASIYRTSSSFSLSALIKYFPNDPRGMRKFPPRTEIKAMLSASHHPQLNVALVNVSRFFRNAASDSLVLINSASNYQQPPLF